MENRQNEIPAEGSGSPPRHAVFADTMAERNDTNELFRAHKAAMRQAAADHAERDLARLRELEAARAIGLKLLNHGLQARISTPDGSRRVDLYLTRGTLVQDNRRLDGVGVDAALRCLGIRAGRAAGR